MSFLHGFVDELIKTGGLPKGLRPELGAYSAKRALKHQLGRGAARAIASGKKAKSVGSAARAATAANDLAETGKRVARGAAAALERHRPIA